METLEFIEERNRMCESFDRGYGCQMCPACDNELCCAVSVMSKLDAKLQVAIVEKWSIEHPKKQRKTRQDVFLEQLPESALDENGVLRICPLYISASHRNSNGLCKNPEKSCMKCHREFWMQEIEEDK